MKVMYWLELNPDEFENQEFKESYGTIIEDLKSDRKSVTFYPVFLLRRLIYAALLIILYFYPKIQLILIVVFTIIPVFFF